MNNAEVGVGSTGREAISIDLTYLGDPLDIRHVRVAFGVYQKHRLRPDLVGPAAAARPPLAVVPRFRRPLLEVLEARGLGEAASAAVTASTVIPDVEPGLARLLDHYETSELARWHRKFDRVRPHGPDEWMRTYDRLDTGTLPPCVAGCLEHPNDLLLKPTHVQLVVRTLLARGWHARHVAGLIWSRYSRPGLWGDHWRRIDPWTRAEFDTRVYAGLLALGLDQGVDFNCVSTQEKGMCPGHGCPYDLRRERDHLAARARP